MPAFRRHVAANSHSMFPVATRQVVWVIDIVGDNGMDGPDKRFAQRRSLVVFYPFGHCIHEGCGVLHLLLFPLTAASQDSCSYRRLQYLTDLLLGQLRPFNARCPSDCSHDVEAVQAVLEMGRNRDAVDHRGEGLSSGYEADKLRVSRPNVHVEMDIPPGHSVSLFSVDIVLDSVHLSVVCKSYLRIADMTMDSVPRDVRFLGSGAG